MLLFSKQHTRRKCMPLFKPQGIFLEMSKNSESRLLPRESASVSGAKRSCGSPAINTGFSRTAKENVFPYAETLTLLFRIHTLIYKK